jgi:lipopolysaccharide/colanic/teichoic acid biosynthesis glycosyltransferase
MRFISTKPERPEFIKELQEKILYYFGRHSVKPNITDWAQVNYSHNASVEDAIEKLQ